MNKNKKRSKHSSIILRLTVILGGLTLLTWKSGVAVRSTLAGMVPHQELAPMGEPILSDAMPQSVPAPVPLLFPPITQEPVAHPANPLKKVDQTVRLHLFADKTLHEAAISSPNGLQVNALQLYGTVQVKWSRRELTLVQGKQSILHVATIVIRPLDGTTPIDLTASKIKRRTTGEIRMTAKSNGIEVVNRLPLEDYVLGTVEPELGSLHLPVEALKAQIIASRSYVLALHDRHPGKDYDFCDNAHCLMYTGIRNYSPRFLQAAADVRGKILTYKGRPAAAFFHHSCGGETAAIEEVWPGPAIPYLTRVVDGKPAYCRYGQWAEWSVTIDRASLQKCFSKAGWLPRFEAIDSFSVIRKDPGGRARDILIQGSQPRWVSANVFRLGVNGYYHQELIRSTMFKVVHEGDRFHIMGRGWGHGVGMCQSGAIHMAHHGQSCQQILSHYFPGTELTTLPSAQKKIKPDPAIKKYLSFFLH